MICACCNTFAGTRRGGLLCAVCETLLAERVGWGHLTWEQAEAALGKLRHKRQARRVADRKSYAKRRKEVARVPCR